MTTLLKIPKTSSVQSDSITVGTNCQIGDDVIIECQELLLGNNVQIGVLTENNFRSSAGVRIKANRVEIRDNVKIDRSTLIKGGNIVIGEKVSFATDITINVNEELTIGMSSILSKGCDIAGVNITMGNACWLGPSARIGGGSCFEIHSKFSAGHYFHLGANSFINTARPVTIGDEVGLGSNTALYTHGAYPSMLAGAPVAFAPIDIGDRVWCPGAIVNPGVKIGHDSIIGVGSVVTIDIPSGSLAAGVPAKVLRENTYPRQLDSNERWKLISEFLDRFVEICKVNYQVEVQKEEHLIQIILEQTKKIIYSDLITKKLQAHIDGSANERVIFIGDTVEPVLTCTSQQHTIIDLKSKTIQGKADQLSEQIVNQLRRYGVRFFYHPQDQQWKDFSS